MTIAVKRKLPNPFWLIAAIVVLLTFNYCMQKDSEYLCDHDSTYSGCK